MYFFNNLSTSFLLFNTVLSLSIGESVVFDLKMTTTQFLPWSWSFLPPRDSKLTGNWHLFLISFGLKLLAWLMERACFWSFLTGVSDTDTSLSVSSSGVIISELTEDSVFRGLMVSPNSRQWFADRLIPEHFGVCAHESEHGLLVSSKLISSSLISSEVTSNFFFIL